MSEALSIFTDDDLEQIRKRGVELAIESAARAAAAEIVPEILPAIREALEARNSELGAMIAEAVMARIKGNLEERREHVIDELMF